MFSRLNRESLSELSSSILTADLDRIRLDGGLCMLL